MKEFDWNRFKYKSNNIAVHCKTIEEANDFCKQMHKHGMRWSSGQSYLNCNHWDDYKLNTCYSNIGCFGDYDYYYEDFNYTILEWSDFMKKEFKKSDLKYGYLVVLRNGNKAIYMPTTDGDYFDYMKDDSCLKADNYNENLMFTMNCCNPSYYDIVAVYGYSNVVFDTITKDLEKRELLWEREEPIKEITMEDLEKHFGCKVKIVNETN